MTFESEDTTEETPEPEAAVEETPEADAAEETPEAEAATEDAPEAAVEDAPEAAAEPEAPAEPEEQLSPKERRARKRSTHSGEAKPARTQEERTAERLAKRAANAAERRRYRARSRARRKEGSSGQGTPPAERTGTGSARILRGTVVSDKADKTITVRIDTARQHRTYGKIVRSSSKVHVHDEQNDANAGDVVRVVESRPLSKSKRWRLIDVVERAQ